MMWVLLLLMRVVTVHISTDNFIPFIVDMLESSTKQLKLKRVINILFRRYFSVIKAKNI